MRLFIGFEIPATAEIEKVLKEVGKFEYVKPVEKEKLHVCVKFLGECTEEDVKKIKTAMGVLEGKFEIKLNGVSAFPNNDFVKVIKINVLSDELKALQEKLEDQLEKSGFGKERREFSPHLTLGRVKRKPDDSLKKLFSDKNYGNFEIKEIKLIQSTLTPEGPVYKTVYVKKL